MRERSINIPLVAIGGITRADIAEIIACGVDGIALSGAILIAKNPLCEMSQIVDMIFTQQKITNPKTLKL